MNQQYQRELAYLYFVHSNNTVIANHELRIAMNQNSFHYNFAMIQINHNIQPSPLVYYFQPAIHHLVPNQDVDEPLSEDEFNDEEDIADEDSESQINLTELSDVVVVRPPRPDGVILAEIHDIDNV